MEDNLETGLEKVFGGSFASMSGDKSSSIASVAGELDAGKSASSVPSDLAKVIRELSRSAMENYNDAQEALKKGNWAKYGESLERMKKDLEKLAEKSKGIQ
jgi:uncharacterized membrane protein (UPF0182 family)